MVVTLNYWQSAEISGFIEEFAKRISAKLMASFQIEATAVLDQAGTIALGGKNSPALGRSGQKIPQIYSAGAAVILKESRRQIVEERKLKNLGRFLLRKEAEIGTEK